MNEDLGIPFAIASLLLNITHLGMLVYIVMASIDTKGVLAVAVILLWSVYTWGFFVYTRKELAGLFSVMLNSITGTHEHRDE